MHSASTKTVTWTAGKEWICVVVPLSVASTVHDGWWFFFSTSVRIPQIVWKKMPRIRMHATNKAARRLGSDMHGTMVVLDLVQTSLLYWRLVLLLVCSIKISKKPSSKGRLSPVIGISFLGERNMSPEWETPRVSESSLSSSIRLPLLLKMFSYNTYLILTLLLPTIVHPATATAAQQQIVLKSAR